MAALTLTPEQVEQVVPGARVTALDIADAADQIAQITGRTVTEHGDDATDGVRLIPVASVRRAWAVVTARLVFLTADSVSGGVTSQSMDGVTYTIDPELLEKVRGDILTGLPRQLLRINHGTWQRIGEHRRSGSQSRYSYPA